MTKLEQDLLTHIRNIDRNTKCTSCGGTDVTTTSGVNTSVPSGLRGVSIVKTSSNLDTVTITLSDSSLYIMSEQGEIFSDSVQGSRTLPTYTITGPGTWKWHGLI